MRPWGRFSIFSAGFCDWRRVLTNSGHPCYVELGINARPQVHSASSLVTSATVGVGISNNNTAKQGAISVFSMAFIP